jgi:hypothetical protein
LTTRKPSLIALLILFLSLQFSLLAAAQKKSNAPQAPLLKRTAIRSEVKRLGHGGTVIINGAPEGSIIIEGWPKSEIEVVAEIEVSAPTEDELAQLAAVTGFAAESDFNRLRVTTVGTHDRKYMKRVARNFPKQLLSMPWKVDYKVRVPALVDLEIATGRGALTLSGVEGAVRLTSGGGASQFTLTGGDFEGTLASGPVMVNVAQRSWRGRGLSLRLASGDLKIELPPIFNGDLNAEVLRSGRVENLHPGLAARGDTQATDHKLLARGGDGGAVISLTVGDGTISIVSKKR